MVVFFLSILKIRQKPCVSLSDNNLESEDSPPLLPGSSLSVLCSLAVLFSWFSSFPRISKQASKMRKIMRNDKESY